VSARSGARLFVAVDPPLEVRERLAAWARGSADGAGTRLVPARLQHLTLAFLGSVEVSEADRIAELALGCAQPVGALATSGPAWLPPRRPRVLAVEVLDGDGALGELQAAVADSLVAAGYYQPERRRYRPHITVARMGGAPRPRPTVGPTPALGFAAQTLTLYRSRLAPTGAEYEALARVPLL
jgi:2'-5' RNA ligase